MKIVFSIIILVTTSGYFSFAMAHKHKSNNQVHPKIYKKCTATKNTDVDPIPAKFSGYNDLTKTEGGFDNPLSKKIVLRGIVLDKNCVPISNAHVKLWQVDSYGVQRYDGELESESEEYKSNYKMYSQFVGSGSATSTNDGYFYAITVKPSEHTKSKKAKNYINIEVHHPNFPEVQNKIYLLDMNQFSKRKKIVLAKNFYNTPDTNMKIYDFEIILDGYSQHSRY